MPTSTLRSNATGQIVWRTTSNWSPATVPPNGNDILYSGNGQFWFDFSTSGLVDFTTGPTFSITCNSSNPTLNYGAGSIASGAGGFPSSTAGIIRLASGTQVTINFPNLSAPAEFGGARWFCSVTNTVFAEKYGNGFLELPGDPATSSGTNLNGVWNVYGGGLVFRTNTGASSAGNNFNGNGVRISAQAGFSGTRIIYGGLYVRGNNCVVGRYYDTGGTWSGTTLSFSGRIQFIDNNTIVGKVMNFYVDGANSTTPAFCGSGESGGDITQLTVDKLGAQTLTISGAAPDSFFTGTLRVSAGAVSLTNTAALQYAKMAGNSGITFSLAGVQNWLFGGIVSSNNWTDPAVSSVHSIGYGNQNCTHTGLLLTSAGTGARFFNKYGTGTQTFNPSGTSTSTGAWNLWEGGTVVAEGNATALGTNDVNSYVYINDSRLWLKTDIQKSQAALTIDDNNASRGALYVDSGTREFFCANFTLNDVKTGLVSLEAATGSTLKVTCSAGCQVTQATVSRGLRKLGAGDVILTAPGGFTFTGNTQLDAGRTTLTGGALNTRPVVLNGGTVWNTVLTSGCTLTVNSTVGGGVESNTASDSGFTATTTVPAATTLTLTPTAAVGGKPVKILGNGALTVNGTLRTGTSQNGRMTYGGNLTFSNGATLKLG